MSDENLSMPHRRRVDDERIENIEQKLAVFERMLSENTTTTNEVRDILITVRTLGKFMAWGGGIVFAVASAWGAIMVLSNGGITP